MLPSKMLKIHILYLIKTNTLIISKFLTKIGSKKLLLLNILGRKKQDSLHQNLIFLYINTVYLKHQLQIKIVIR